MEWEEIFANSMCNKELIFKIHKKQFNLNSQKINNSIGKWAKNLNRHLTKENIQMTNRYMKRYST